MKVVLDTNILISAMIAPASIPARIFHAWLQGRFILLSHPAQLDELRIVTRREHIRKRLRRSEAGRFVNLVKDGAELLNRLPRVSRSPDPDDDYLLALAEAGDADALVTVDKADLLALGRHGATRIVTAAAFAQELGL